MYNYKTVFYTLGTLQIILGVFMLIPVIIQLIFNELDSGFVSASIITIVFGVLFFLSNLDHDKNIDLPQAFILTALSWLSIAIFGSLPFVFSKLNSRNRFSCEHVCKPLRFFGGLLTLSRVLQCVLKALQNRSEKFKSHFGSTQF